MEIIDRKMLTALATEEITNIKKHATKEQKKRLDLADFYPNSPKDCIYGQMTGNCNSAAALRLIRLCAPNKSKHCVRPIWEDRNAADSCTIARDYTFRQCYSPLEEYLFSSTNRIQAHIINFIKGKCKKLQLEIIEKIEPIDDDLPF
jgi:hypothetical protein